MKVLLGLPQGSGGPLSRKPETFGKTQLDKPGFPNITALVLRVVPFLERVRGDTRLII